MCYFHVADCINYMDIAFRRNSFAIMANAARSIFRTSLSSYKPTRLPLRQPRNFGQSVFWGRRQYHHSVRRGTSWQLRKIRPSQRVIIPPPEHYDAEKQIYIANESSGIIYNFERDFECVHSPIPTVPNGRLDSYLCSMQIL